MTQLKFEPLTGEELGVKAGTIKQKLDGKLYRVESVQLVPYIKNRETCSIRLDQAVGPDRWQNVFIPQGDAPICEIKIYFPDRGWVTRADTGESPMPDGSLKPAYSDAFKRAAYKWGIGRELFYLPTVEVSGESLNLILEGEEQKCVGFYDTIVVEKVKVEGTIPKVLVLKNKSTGKVVYSYDAETGETTPAEVYSPAKKGGERKSASPTKSSPVKETPSPTQETSSPVEDAPAPEKTLSPIQETPENLFGDESPEEAISPVQETPEKLFADESPEEAMGSAGTTYKDAQSVLSDIGTFKGVQLGQIEAKQPSSLLWLYKRTLKEEVRCAIVCIAHNNGKLMSLFIEDGIAI